MDFLKTATAIAAAAAISTAASAAVPAGTARIAWDYNTKRDITEMYVDNKGYIEKNFIYPRIKRLKNGQLMMTFMNHRFGQEPYVALSDDDGATWHNVQRLQEQKNGVSTAGEDTFVYVNPDFVELADGRIMLAYQCRWKKGYNDLPHTNENCFIEIMFSEDNGLTWGEAKRIYTGRCWEPAMTQLPSGEIQMYITDSNDVRYKRSQPCTMLIRSFDGGKTWQGKEHCSYKDGEVMSRTIDERGTYDGMASSVILDDGTIAVPIEVWAGGLKVDQSPVIITTDKETNWKSDQLVRQNGGPEYPLKKQVHKDLYAYGPYITRLPSGEPIVLASGLFKGQQGMWALIGDKNADNFGNASRPFSGYWGNIDYIGNDRIIATGTSDYTDNAGNERHKITMATGRINRSKTATKGAERPAIDVKGFNRDKNGFWFLGHTAPSSVFTNFGYDGKSFIIDTYLFDNELQAFTPENSDASAVLFARQKKDGSFDTYKALVNPQGKYLLYQERGTSWVLIDKGTVPVDLEGTVNNDKDSDLGFGARLEIPWDKIGGAPRKGEQIRAHLRHHYRTTKKEGPVAASIEDAEGENTDYPSEWLSVTLQ